MSPEQRDLARSALGLDERNTRSYRNHYITDPKTTAHLEWMLMECRGLAWRRRGSGSTGTDDLFGLTVEGARAALRPGETLCPEDFPHQSM